MDLEAYRSLKNSFDGMFASLSKYEMKQNEDARLYKKKIRRNLYRLKRKITEQGATYERPAPLKPIWLDIL